VSKRQLFTNLPVGFQVPWGYDWCARCRRPTTYAIRPGHHAMRRAIVITHEDAHRCYYCGARAVLASVNPNGYYVGVSA
jgi:DNA-directed RNA polymerase subunit RPC12/RpoP